MRPSRLLRLAWATVFALGCGELVTGCGDSMMNPPPSADLTMTGPPDTGVIRDLVQPPTDDLEAPVEDLEVPLEDMALPGEDLPMGEDMPMGGEDMPSGSDDMEQFTDLAQKPCDNNKTSCGQPGQCLDCTGNTVGEACVNAACGCNSSADCPKGKACDPIKKQCSDACAGGLDCHGGCCDGQKCVDGNASTACGGDGKACKPCGGGTPSCAMGACTSACVVGKIGDPGVCGQGFCCNAQNQCAAIGNGACGVGGGVCADCAKSAAGPTCLMNGTCGCAKAADCAPGQACKGGVCGTACDANTACNGGCCANNVCVAGSTSTACALGQVLCGTCVGNAAGAACVTANNKTACGCNTAADCPANRACDPLTKQCTTKCDANNPCNGGCCSAAMNGTCTTGVAKDACGNNGGVCVGCANNNNGHVCVPAQGGGQCGCNILGDCPITSVACDGNRKICNNTCSAQQPCQFGCCSAAQNGICQNGTAGSACGKAGVCVNCANAAAGAVCLPNQVCGCNGPSDCPKGQACNLNTKTCENRCTATQTCNGGCCSNPGGGTCLAGTANGACGGQAICLDCATTKVGRVCLGGTKCGCNSAADCGALQACDQMTKQCTDVCNANQLCNGGCCQAGRCVDGTANSACGGTGGACAACVNAKPTCEKGACTAKCGGPGNGTCGGGNCCRAGLCVPGNVQSNCGYSGACLDCATQSTGTKCIAPNNAQSWFCGCDARTDCLAAKPLAGIPGYACDTVGRTCTSLCGAMGLSGCNGGCCSGASGQCRAGGADTTCGVSGGFCTNCTASCNLGPKCNANSGTCGCTDLTQCFFTDSCWDNGVTIREACSVPKGSCCIPTQFNLPARKDGGNPANCCTGMSQNGLCTCIRVGQPSTGDASKCCSLHDTNGTCSCLPNGAACLFPGDANGECCSGKCGFNFTCVAAVANEPCQSDAGCRQGLRCVNGRCQ